MYENHILALVHTTLGTHTEKANAIYIDQYKYDMYLQSI